MVYPTTQTVRPALISFSEKVRPDFMVQLRTVKKSLVVPVMLVLQFWLPTTATADADTAGATRPDHQSAVQWPGHL